MTENEFASQDPTRQRQQPHTQRSTKEPTTDQVDIEARKAASAAGAADNSGIGVDGDDPSAADGNDVDPGDDSDATNMAAPDPVTGSVGHATGERQAADNEDREPTG